jgi:plasmid stabilization system protein ParE
MNVVLSPEAVERLEEQIAYLRDVGAVAAAERLRTRVMQFLSRHLAKYPRTERAWWFGTESKVSAYWS